MKRVSVECYAGYRAVERPMRLTLGEQTLEIAEVEDRWYSPGAVYFRVKAEDGNFYILRHDEGMDSWTLDGFRAGDNTGISGDSTERNSSSGPHGAS